ncbi:uncharacterized protein LOC144132482 isoform X1 [Amblyomma americanum]
MRSNFTRREEGYKALRALVCDTEKLKGGFTARNCSDLTKLGECVSKQIDGFDPKGDDPVERICGNLPAQEVCYNESWISSCPMSLPSAVAVVKDILDAIELIHDCKSMYGHEGTTSETRSDAVSLNNLAAEVAEIRALLRENTHAVVALTDKVKENNKILKQHTASVEHVEGALREFGRSCKPHSEAPAEQPRVVF